jgi:hypothetical protein
MGFGERAPKRSGIEIATIGRRTWTCSHRPVVRPLTRRKGAGDGARQARRRRARACSASSRTRAMSASLKTPLAPEIAASFMPCFKPIS